MKVICGGNKGREVCKRQGQKSGLFKVVLLRTVLPSANNNKLELVRISLRKCLSASGF